MRDELWSKLIPGYQKICSEVTVETIVATGDRCDKFSISLDCLGE